MITKESLFYLLPKVVRLPPNSHLYCCKVNIRSLFAPA